jgi:hypothetical protein
MSEPTPLETFVPRTKEVMAGGRTIAVGPLRIRQVDAFAKAIQPALDMLSCETDGEADIVDLLVLRGHELRGAIIAATDLPESFVGDLVIDDNLKLLNAVLEVNGDFFGAMLRRRLRVHPELLQAAIANLGPASSTDSSAPVTPGQDASS